MKKILCLLLVALLAISIPIALAQNNAQSLTSTNLVAKSANRINKSNILRKRVIAAKQIQSAVKAYNIAKVSYVNHSLAYKEKRRLFLADKKELNKCKNQDTEECEQLIEQANDHAKEFLINGANMLIEHLNKIKEKIASSEDMDEEKAQEIISDIEDKIEEIEEIIQEIENAITKQEIKDAARKLHNIWKHYKHRERLYVSRLVHAKVWGILQRSKHLPEKLDKILERMEEKGIDISEVQDLVDQFNEYIDEAESKYLEAKELLKEAYDLKKNNINNENKEDIRSLVKEVEALLKEAKTALTNANRTLSTIVKEIRSQGGDITDDNEEEEDEENNETEVD